MRVYDQATAEVKQGGTRRGANMGILSVEHPDIEDFITCKSDMVTLQNFNISVAMTDKFMQRVVDGDDEANRIFNIICMNAYNNGDPGLFFIDTANKANPTPKLGGTPPPPPPPAVASAEAGLSVPPLDLPPLPTSPVIPTAVEESTPPAAPTLQPLGATPAGNPQADEAALAEIQKELDSLKSAATNDATPPPTPPPAPAV